MVEPPRPSNPSPSPNQMVLTVIVYSSDQQSPYFHLQDDGPRSVSKTTVFSFIFLVNEAPLLGYLSDRMQASLDFSSLGNFARFSSQIAVQVFHSQSDRSALFRH